MAIKIALFVLLVTIASSLAAENLMITLSARNLPDEDICCSPPVYPPDSYVVIHYSPDNFEPVVERGRTRVVGDSNNPDWTDVFVFEIKGSLTSTLQRLKLEVWDADVDSDDYIGFVDVSFSKILSTFGYVVEQNLSPVNSGSLRIAGQIQRTGEVTMDTFAMPGHRIHLPNLVVKPVTVSILERA